MADPATQKTLADILKTVQRIDKRDTANRQRHAKGHKALLEKIDQLNEAVKDDATKAQVRSLRKLVETLEAEDVAAETEEDA